MAPQLPAVPRVRLGSQGLEVSHLGLGCMGMSAFYGPPKPEADMIALIHHALHLGVTFLDTSDAYGPFSNEELLGKALKGVERGSFQVATKFAFARDEAGKVGVRGDPAHVRAACEGSLQRLGLEYVDLYYQHRVDPKVPIEITVGEMKKLVEEGKVKYLGLSEASVEDIRRAHAVHPISAIQLEWSLWSRDAEPQLIPLCRELGIGIVPYSPLGRGVLGGKGVVEKWDKSDWRNSEERTSEASMEKNKVFYERLCALAAPKDCTAAQLALAWVLAQGLDVAPIPGTTRMAKLEENVGALGLKLSKEDLSQIEQAVPESEVVGARYSDHMMQMTWAHTVSPPLHSWKQ